MSCLSFAVRRKEKKKRREEEGRQPLSFILSTHFGMLLASIFSFFFFSFSFPSTISAVLSSPLFASNVYFGCLATQSSLSSRAHRGAKHNQLGPCSRFLYPLLPHRCPQRVPHRLGQCSRTRRATTGRYLGRCASSAPHLLRFTAPAASIGRIFAFFHAIAV